MRTPEYIEQLVSPMLLRHHNITSMTPIHTVNPLPLDCSYTPVLEVPVDTTGQYIRATLACHNLPSSSIKENKRVLEAYAATIGKKVVYVQKKNDVVEKTDKKVQRVIKTKKAVPNPQTAPAAL